MERSFAARRDTGLTHVDFGDVTSNCLQNGGTCIVNLANGWRLQLEEPGEKVLATPLTLTGKTFFTTYLPQGGSGATACSPSESFSTRTESFPFPSICRSRRPRPCPVPR